jgi:NAD(P)-dependent dehydrogenase (short-subunit alcohol dehydrogenase family)
VSTTPEDLAGKVALVTGAASGLGLAMAQRFMAGGARVVAVDVSREALAALPVRDDLLPVFGDVTDPASIAAAFDAGEARFGAVDIVVANAGISQNCPTLDLDLTGWRRVMAINLDGVFVTAQEAGRRMLARGRGVILMTSSIYGVVAGPERLAYVVSKSGVSAMAKALALEWSPLGLRVNAIAPGYVRTPFLDDLIARGRLDADALIAHTPIRRFVTPEEVADLVAFLACDRACAITGQVSGVEGGWTANGYL